MPKYAELIYNGFWFSPEREMLQAAIDQSQEFVTGRVRLKLYKGNVGVVGRESPYSLYDQDLVTFEEGKVAYDQRDAAGFIRLNALRLRTLGQRKRKLKLEAVTPQRQSRAVASRSAGVIWRASAARGGRSFGLGWTCRGSLGHDGADETFADAIESLRHASRTVAICHGHLAVFAEIGLLAGDPRLGELICRALPCLPARPIIRR